MKYNNILIIDCFFALCFFKDERIQPVCMPPPNFNLAENDKCIAVGWGRIHRNAAELASSLHEVDLRIKNMAYCKSFLIKRSLRDAQLCAYSPEKVRSYSKIPYYISSQLFALRRFLVVIWIVAFQDVEL